MSQRARRFPTTRETRLHAEHARLAVWQARLCTRAHRIECGKTERFPGRFSTSGLLNLRALACRRASATLTFFFRMAFRSRLRDDPAAAFPSHSQSHGIFIMPADGAPKGSWSILAGAAGTLDAHPPHSHFLKRQNAPAAIRLPKCAQRTKKCVLYSAAHGAYNGNAKRRDGANALQAANPARKIRLRLFAGNRTA